jgi:hypothetical protein
MNKPCQNAKLVKQLVTFQCINGALAFSNVSEGSHLQTHNIKKGLNFKTENSSRTVDNN